MGMTSRFCIFLVLCGTVQAGLWLSDSVLDHHAHHADFQPLKTAPNQDRDPIILVPGLSGTVLEGKLDKSSSPHWWCEKKSDWYLLWLSAEMLLPEVVECFKENFRGHFDNTTGKYHNTEGVTTRMHGKYGSVDAIYCLDPTTGICSKSGVYAKMIEYFKSAGYEVGVDLFGAPYDFRWGTNQYVHNDEGSGSFAQLQTLVEHVHQTTGRKPHLASISNGGTYLAYFFNYFVNQEWKDEHVGSFISMSGVMRGSPWALYALVSPFQWRVPLVKATMMVRLLSAMFPHPLSPHSIPVQRSLVRTFGSLVWLSPPSMDEWWRDQVLVSTPERNYTAAQYEDLFESMGNEHAEDSLKIYESMKDDPQWLLGPPNVTMHVLYGHNCPTNITYIYNEWPPKDDLPSDAIAVDGDGTVEMHSLVDTPKAWAKQQSHPITFTGYDGVQHADLLWTKQVWDDILEIATPS